MGGVNDLPPDALAHALSWASAATLVRCALTCRALRHAAERAACERAPSLGIELPATACAEGSQERGWGGRHAVSARCDVDEERDDEPPWERSARRPLAAVYAAELSRLLRRAAGDARARHWHKSAAFVYFRLTERHLDHVLGDGEAEPGEPMLVATTGQGCASVEWLHDHSWELCQLYEATRTDGRPHDWGELNEVGLCTHETLWWPSSGGGYLEFTAHLGMHPLYGRPQIDLDALLQTSDPGRLTDLGTLREWLRNAEGKERARFDADVRGGFDAAVLLSRFSRDPWTRRGLLYGGGGREQHLLSQFEVQRMLDLVEVSPWQQRPRQCVLRERRFFHDVFEAGPPVHSAHDGCADETMATSHTMRHMAVGDPYGEGCFFVCTLSFFDAIERVVARASGSSAVCLA